MMRTLTFILTITAAALSGCESGNQTPASSVDSSIAETTKSQEQSASVKQPNKIRPEVETARDMYRHPAETLIFFEVEPEHTVVEIWPGAGWYTAILAPYLRQRGHLIAAHFPLDSDIPFFRKSRLAFQQRFLNDVDSYGHIEVTDLAPPEHLQIANAGEADRVLTFRNVHNWMRNNQEQAVFDAAYRALKPGGILGVVEHRAPPDFNQQQMIESGYVSVAYVTQLAINAGFEPAGQSEVNANPKDKRDHINGVWSLPPTLRGGEIDRDAFLDIGESDRMTLKFRKP